jgi:hypothetical protein
MCSSGLTDSENENVDEDELEDDWGTISSEEKRADEGQLSPSELEQIEIVP